MCEIRDQTAFDIFFNCDLVMPMPHLTRFKLWNNNVQSLVLMYGEKLLFSCPFYIEKLKMNWLKLIDFYIVTNLVEAA